MQPHAGDVTDAKYASKKTVYEQLTVAALEAMRTARTPRDAWAHAQGLVNGSPSTLAKGCPRSTFVSLAEHGYVAGVQPGSGVGEPLSLNARHALEAYRVSQAKPELIDDKLNWWRATRDASGTSRENHNGILDVLRALILERVLVIPSER